MENFMSYATCNIADFLHPIYNTLCRKLRITPRLQRKQWEFIYIIYQLYRKKVLHAQAKGLGFGVGSEPLCSFFASLGCQIVATDAPPEIAARDGWTSTAQYANNLDTIYKAEILDRALFNQTVRFQVCDMNQIDPNLTGFDFCWSSCCFEHLGSLQAGIDFVVNSVEKTLRPGGIACHTTEYNLSSNDKTLDNGVTVIYRKRDIDQLVETLRQRGHQVEPIQISPKDHPLGNYVDIPTYCQDIHLKLQLQDYVVTSIGLVIQRGDPSLK